MSTGNLAENPPNQPQQILLQPLPASHPAPPFLQPEFLTQQPHTPTQAPSALQNHPTTLTTNTTPSQLCKTPRSPHVSPSNSQSSSLIPHHAPPATQVKRKTPTNFYTPHISHHPQSRTIQHHPKTLAQKTSGQPINSSNIRNVMGEPDHSMGDIGSNFIQIDPHGHFGGNTMINTPQNTASQPNAQLNTPNTRTMKDSIPQMTSTPSIHSIAPGHCHQPPQSAPQYHQYQLYPNTAPSSTHTSRLNSPTSCSIQNMHRKSQFSGEQPHQLTANGFIKPNSPPKGHRIADKSGTSPNDLIFQFRVSDTPYSSCSTVETDHYSSSIAHDQLDVLESKSISHSALSMLNRLDITSLPTPRSTMSSSGIHHSKKDNITATHHSAFILPQNQDNLQQFNGPSITSINPHGNLPTSVLKPHQPPICRKVPHIEEERRRQEYEYTQQYIHYLMSLQYYHQQQTHMLQQQQQHQQQQHQLQPHQQMLANLHHHHHTPAFHPPHLQQHPHFTQPQHFQQYLPPAPPQAPSLVSAEHRKRIQEQIEAHVTEQHQLQQEQLQPQQQQQHYYRQQQQQLQDHRHKQHPVQKQHILSTNTQTTHKSTFTQEQLSLLHKKMESLPLDDPQQRLKMYLDFQQDQLSRQQLILPPQAQQTQTVTNPKNNSESVVNLAHSDSLLPTTLSDNMLAVLESPVTSVSTVPTSHLHLNYIHDQSNFFTVPTMEETITALSTHFTHQTQTYESHDNIIHLVLNQYESLAKTNEISPKPALNSMSDDVSTKNRQFVPLMVKNNDKLNIMCREDFIPLLLLFQQQQQVLIREQERLLQVMTLCQKCGLIDENQNFIFEQIYPPRHSIPQPTQLNIHQTTADNALSTTSSARSTVAASANLTTPSSTFNELPPSITPTGRISKTNTHLKQPFLSSNFNFPQKIQNGTSQPFDDALFSLDSLSMVEHCEQEQSREDREFSEKRKEFMKSVLDDAIARTFLQIYPQALQDGDLEGLYNHFIVVKGIEVFFKEKYLCYLNAMKAPHNLTDQSDETSKDLKILDFIPFVRRYMADEMARQYRGIGDCGENDRISPTNSILSPNPLDFTSDLTNPMTNISAIQHIIKNEADYYTIQMNRMFNSLAGNNDSTTTVNDGQSNLYYDAESFKIQQKIKNDLFLQQQDPSIREFMEAEKDIFMSTGRLLPSKDDILSHFDGLNESILLQILDQQ